jgi:hypothetical protein
LLIVYLGYEVLTAAVVKGSVFWDITHCNLLKVENRTLLATRVDAGFCFVVFFNLKERSDMFL